MSTTASPTKEWFKNQLINHGVTLPATSAKKEEYQRLYDEHVKPLKANNAEFSSDDEGHPVEVGQAAPGGADKSINDWIAKLNDGNIFTVLKSNGKNVGPVTASTRELYQRMLFEILKADIKAAQANTENFLAENEGAREQWESQGLSFLNLGSALPTTAARTNGTSTNGTNGARASMSKESISNGGGNSENGYSDTDEEDFLETASRASRSSRASSRSASSRGGPRSRKFVRPSAAGTDLTQSGQSSGIGSSAGGTRDLSGVVDVDEGNEEEESEDENSSQEGASVGSSQSSGGSPAKTFLASRTANTTYARSSTSYSSSSYLNRLDYERTPPEELAARHNPKPLSRAQEIGYLAARALLLFVLVVVIPMAAYYYLPMFNQTKSASDVPEQEDELDLLLKQLDDAGQGNA